MVLVGPGASWPKKGVKGALPEVTAPPWSAQGPPTSNSLEKPGKPPRTLQKERQVSKRVKQRAANLFTYKVSKGGNPNERSH